MGKFKNKIFAEFTGTALLVCVVVGSGIMGQNLSDGNDGIALLANSLATFWGLYFLITIFAPLSAHFNPVVSLVSYIRGELKFPAFISFVAVQCLGGLLGAVLANLMFNLPLIELSTKIRTGSNLWFSELIATAGLIMIIFASDAKKVPIMVASYIGAAYWFTASTSFANPAVTFGRIFSDTFAGINLNDAPLFIIFQIMGGLLGYLIYKVVWDK
jgi:glycerol uptake facilitator-like aquaporin